jgi:exodeoxyribonuclease VII large subunit
VKQQDLFGGPAPPARPSPPARPVPLAASPVKVTPPALLAPVPPPPPLQRAEPLLQPAWRAPRPQAKVLSVSELTNQIKGLIEPPFSRLIVRGEVTSFRGPNARGHLYFSIKDANAVVEVRLWQTLARSLKFQLKDGLSVIIEGSLNVYEPQGRYSVIVQKLEPEGVGARALAYEQLKQKLAAEGLLGELRKKPRRPLPFLPRRIGVVTSLSGAALRDFLKVLHRRHPRLPVLVADARVQGEGAALEVRRAIRALGRTDVDVIVVTRGGGSVDDLWTFNEEAVARAIFESPVPVISAVGHEIDTTLADLVADFRAPTPSAAAEAITPVLAELELQLGAFRAHLVRLGEKTLLARKHELKALRAGVGDPRRRLSEQRLFLSDAAERSARVLRRQLRDGREELKALGGRLQGARPQAQLKQRRQAFLALETRLTAAAQKRLAERRASLARLALALERATPRPRLQRARQQLAFDARRLEAAGRGQLLRGRQIFGGLSATLDALSPLKVLGRGYAIVQTAGGGVVHGAEDTGVGAEVHIRLAHDDALVATVTQVKPGPK